MGMAEKKKAVKPDPGAVNYLELLNGVKY